MMEAGAALLPRPKLWTQHPNVWIKNATFTGLRPSYFSSGRAPGAQNPPNEQGGAVTRSTFSFSTGA
jgi:hypothetical protein